MAAHASIAHEVTNHRGRHNAEAALALARARRRSGEVGSARPYRQGYPSAGDVIGRIRELSRKRHHEGPLDMNEAIREVIGYPWRSGQEWRRCRRPSGGLALVEGDRVQLQQVVLNLIVNAVRQWYARQGPRSCSHDVTPNEWRAGRGEGFGTRLDPANLEQLFAPFYTTKPTVWAWGCRSAVQSSKLMAAGYG